jgi:hypothetical protein
MGARSDIQDSLKEAYDNELSDFVTQFSISKKDYSGDYDLAEGKRAVIESNHYSRGIFSVVDSKKVNGESIKSTDEILVVIASELDCDILIDDEIITDSGAVYIVIDPAPVLGGDSIPVIYESQVRKNGR